MADELPKPIVSDAGDDGRSASQLGDVEGHVGHLSAHKAN